MRCFLAVEIPEEVKSSLNAVISDANKLGVAASFCRPEQLHITLLFLGEKSYAQVKEIQSRLSALDFPKFPVSIQGAGFFPNDDYVRVFWAGAECKNNELQSLHNAACALLGEKPERVFTGHVTLARIKGVQGLPELKRFKDSLAGRKFGEFTAGAVVLKKSTLGPQGAAYEDLNTFPLK